MQATLEREYELSEDEKFGDDMCSVHLKQRSDILLMRFARAKQEKDMETGYRTISEATDYGNGPLWSVSDVENWAEHARREVGSPNAFVVDERGCQRGSNTQRERKVIPGLVFSRLVPTMPLREVLLDRLGAGATLQEIVRSSADILSRLTGDGNRWADDFGVVFKRDVGILPVTGGNTRTIPAIRSFIDITRASAIAIALGVAPIELGA